VKGFPGGGAEMSIQFSTAQIPRVVMIRVKPGNDLIQGIEEACDLLGIRSGVITCGIGSLQKASFMFLVPLDNRMGAGYCDPITVEGPMEILSAQGMIGEEETGDLFVHLHGSFSDKSGHVHGGHWVKGRNPVLFTAEVMICEVEGTRMLRLHDPEVDMKVLMPCADEKAQGVRSGLSMKGSE
jgi:predicted DNA-binding protein with PD1-like motif